MAAAIEIIVEGDQKVIELHVPQNVPKFEFNVPQTANPIMTSLADWQDPYQYIGKAFAGSELNAPVWKITRIEISAAGAVLSTVVLQNAKWTDRLIIDYE